MFNLKNTFHKFFSIFFRTNLPHKPYSFQFNYYASVRDPKNKTLKQERIKIGDGLILYEILIEDISGRHPGEKPKIILKNEQQINFQSEFQSFYSFLRKNKFHRIGLPGMHVSVYPDAPTIYSVMSLEVWKKKGDEPKAYEVFDSSELALEGINKYRYQQIEEYMQKLLNIHFKV